MLLVRRQNLSHSVTALALYVIVFCDVSTRVLCNRQRPASCAHHHVDDDDVGLRGRQRRAVLSSWRQSSPDSDLDRPRGPTYWQRQWPVPRTSIVPVPEV